MIIFSMAIQQLVELVSRLQGWRSMFLDPFLKHLEDDFDSVFEIFSPVIILPIRCCHIIDEFIAKGGIRIEGLSSGCISSPDFFCFGFWFLRNGSAYKRIDDLDGSIIELNFCEFDDFFSSDGGDMISNFDFCVLYFIFVSAWLGFFFVLRCWFLSFLGDDKWFGQLLL